MINGKNLSRSALIIIITAACSCSSRTSYGKPENLGIFAPSRLSMVAGQDGCNPVRLTNDTVMWTFGDTILGKWEKTPSLKTTFESSAMMEKMISNSLAFSGVPDAGNMPDPVFVYYTQNGVPVQFLKYRKGEDKSRVRLWPLDGIRIRDSVYLYYLKVLVGKEQGPDLLKVTGTGIAVWNIPQKWKVGNRVSFRRVKMLFGSSMPCMGDSVIMKSGYLYIAGHGKTGRGSGVSAYIARVRPAGILDPSAYSFLGHDGTWSGNSRNPACFFHDVMGEFSISYHSGTGEYIFIYCGSDSAVSMLRLKALSTIRSAVPVDVYRPPALPEIQGRSFYFYYSAKEIFHDDKSVYAVYMNPAVYQPVLVRIPLNSAALPD